MVITAIDDPRPFLFTPEQYQHMADLGWFAGLSVNGQNGQNNGEQARLMPPRRFTRHEYYQMGELGWFIGRRVMLIEGEILEMAVQGPEHSASVDEVHEILKSVFGAGFWVRSQAPLDICSASDAEPDVSVVDGGRDDYRKRHPTTARLAVEVSDTTLNFDRTRKASLYAAAKIADYWIVNLPDRELIVHRKPVPDATRPYGWRYDEVITLTAADSVTPLAAPLAKIAVADLLPK